MKRDPIKSDTWGAHRGGAAEHKEPLRNSTEVAKLFGFKTTSGLNSSVNKKYFPQPDSVFRCSKRTRLYWKLSTLKAEAERRGLKIDF